MNRIKEFFAQPRIRMAIVVGLSIITLAYFSKRVLPEPLNYLELATPPFLGTLFETLTSKKNAAWYGRTSFGILLVVLATALIIVLNA